MQIRNNFTVRKLHFMSFWLITPDALGFEDETGTTSAYSGPSGFCPLQPHDQMDQIARYKEIR